MLRKWLVSSKYLRGEEERVDGVSQIRWLKTEEYDEDYYLASIQELLNTKGFNNICSLSQKSIA